VAIEILSHHLNSFDFIYLDEISFNLEIRPVKGWGVKKLKILNLASLRIIQPLFVWILMDQLELKGGVKSGDFILFLMELIQYESHRFQKKKVILLMDNAKIHHSKEYMQVFTKFYNVLYNAAYTPQLNPIEFMFSKLKITVKKLSPLNENDLVMKILLAATSITPYECAEYIIHSCKYLKDAYECKEFY